MKLLKVVVVMVVASTTVAGATEWAVDPSAGWLEDATVAQALRDNIKATPGGARADLHAWQPADRSTAILQTQWVVLDRGDGTDQSVIDQFDRGIVQGIAKSVGTSDKQTDQPQRTVGSTMIRDTTIDTPQLRVRTVRRYQPATDSLLVLLLACSGEAATPPCSAAVDGGRLSVANARPLDGGGSKHSPAYDAGYVTGTVATLGLETWLVFRKRA